MENLLAKSTKVHANGKYKIIAELWNSQKTDVVSTGEGEWTIPRDEILVKSITENKNIVDDRVIKIYRKKINSHIRKIKLNNESTIQITYTQKLLTLDGWKDNLNVKGLVRTVRNDMNMFTLSSINSIERIQYNDYVYSLETEIYGNYVAEGVFCHDSRK
jgi:intein/homing endonuclease